MRNILRLCKNNEKNAKLITEDPILLSKQNPIAKFIITRDRGLNVRTKSQYLELVKAYFKKINSKLLINILYRILGSQWLVENEEISYYKFKID